MHWASVVRQVSALKTSWTLSVIPIYMASLISLYYRATELKIALVIR